jgi:hypothetical protein
MLSPRLLLVSGLHLGRAVPHDGGCMPQTREPEPDEALIRAIVRYVATHPDAKDTIEGVMRWWLPENVSERRREEVEAGLHRLVERGWIVARVIAPARAVYCANRERLPELRAYAAHE